jgi:ABC-type phosphate transport system substrate-binding protein
MFGFGKKKSARGLRASLLAGATVVALALGGLDAGSASAALECNGNNITGQGASLQKVIQQEVWKPGFEGGICNKGTFPTITYNSTGSGAGLKEWNHDGKKGSINTGLAWISTDDAPTAEQITNITSVAGGASLLTIPVVQTAISVVANPPAGCEIEKITNIDLEAVFRGSYLTWSKISTASGECNSPITRVVRKDGSGTTYQFKNYLSKINKGGLPCTSGGTEGKASWKELEPITNGETGAPNTTWPESCPPTKTLSTLLKPAANGGGEVVKTVVATPGSIGYAALPDAKANGAPVVLAIQNNGQKIEGATYGEAEAEGQTANCSQASYEVPANARNVFGSTALNVDWSKVFGANPGIGGSGYPICTITYALSFKGYKAAGFGFKNYVTVHDYLKEYVVAAAGQEAAKTSGKYYAPLPTAEKPRFDVLGAAQFAASKMSY